MPKKNKNRRRQHRRHHHHHHHHLFFFVVFFFPTFRAVFREGYYTGLVNAVRPVDMPFGGFVDTASRLRIQDKRPRDKRPLTRSHQELPDERPQMSRHTGFSTFATHVYQSTVALSNYRGVGPSERNPMQNESKFRLHKETGFRSHGISF